MVKRIDSLLAFDDESRNILADGRDIKYTRSGPSLGHINAVLTERADEITRLQSIVNAQARALEAAERDAARMRALLTAAESLRDDLKLRADIGTFDGDHDIQASDGAWQAFTAAIDAARGERDDK